MSEDIKNTGAGGTPLVKANPLAKKKESNLVSLTCLSTIRDPYSGSWFKVGQVYEDVEVVPDSWLHSQVQAGLFSKSV